MEFTAEDAKTLIRAAWAILSSPVAQRVYVLVVSAAVLAASLRAAIRADQRATRNIADAERELGTGVPGPPPASLNGFLRQQKCIILPKADKLIRGAWIALGVSFLAGVVVPISLLFLATWKCSWLDGAGDHLMDASGHPLSDPTVLQAALFAVDQTFRGGLFDVLEVFGWQITPLDNNPDNIWFSIGVVLHHLFVEAFIFSGILLFGRSRWQIHNFLTGALLRNWEKCEAKAPGLAPRPSRAYVQNLRRLQIECPPS